MRNKKKKNTKSKARLKGFLLPNVLADAVEKYASEHDCSQSWVVTEALLKFGVMSKVDFLTARGYELPKFSDRKGAWTPAKGGDIADEYRECTDIGCRHKEEPFPVVWDDAHPGWAQTLKGGDNICFECYERRENI